MGVGLLAGGASVCACLSVLPGVGCVTSGLGFVFSGLVVLVWLGLFSLVVLAWGGAVDPEASLSVTSPEAVASSAAGASSALRFIHFI